MWLFSFLIGMLYSIYNFKKAYYVYLLLQLGVSKKLMSISLEVEIAILIDTFGTRTNAIGALDEEAWPM